jgi:hypothetical protein
MASSPTVVDSVEGLLVVAGDAEWVSDGGVFVSVPHAAKSMKLQMQVAIVMS